MPRSSSWARRSSTSRRVRTAFATLGGALRGAVRRGFGGLPAVTRGARVFRAATVTGALYDLLTLVQYLSREGRCVYPQDLAASSPARAAASAAPSPSSCPAATPRSSWETSTRPGPPRRRG